MLKLKLFRHSSDYNRNLLRNSPKNWQKSGYQFAYLAASFQLQKLNHLNVNYDIIDEGDKFAQESHKMQNANVKSESVFTKT